MSRREPTAPRLVVALALAGLASGLALAGVYLATRPRILRNQAEALRAAVLEVLPGTERIAAHVERDGRLQPYEGPEGEPPREPAVFAGRREDGSLVGFAVPADGPGFMDTIGLIYGFDPARRTIIGMRVLESRETPGLGDKIVHDSEFLANFRALAIEPRIEPVKQGEKSRPNEVDCITGATISSQAVVDILQESTDRWTSVLESAALDVTADAPSGGPLDPSRSGRTEPAAPEGRRTETATGE